MDRSARRGGASAGAARTCRLIAVGLTLLAGLGAPSVASSHPLGNFSVNHLTYVEISSDRIDLLYVLDQAEIPTFREQQTGISRSELLERKRAHVLGTLVVSADGRRLKLRPRPGASISFPPGQAGLDLTRVEVPLTARVKDVRAVEIKDFSYQGLVGYTGFVARAGNDTAVRTNVSRADPTRGLRTYQGITAARGAGNRVARFEVRPGEGTLVAPGAAEGQAGESKGDEGFTQVFEDAASGRGFFLFLLLAAFGWGALHALSPGHGKAMVAAYLVGTRGAPRHAVSLGAIVTVTHTIGVFALGLVTLALSQYILPEDLYPWLNLASGLLIVAVGIGILRARLRWRKERLHAAGSGTPAHEHPGHDHHHPHGPDAGDHFHDHGHAHSHVPETTWKGLAGMGISAGIIPCPSALVVLLAAISQDEVGLGLLLLVAFSLGLACTLTSLGLAVVYGRRVTDRFARGAVTVRLLAALPAASTLVILGLGIVLTARALPDVM